MIGTTHLGSNCQVLKFCLYFYSKFSHLRWYPKETIDMQQKFTKRVFFIMEKIGNGLNVQ